jgi:hypothetical protein
VAFAGSVVLGYLVGKESAVPVAVGALVLNLIEVPVTLILLEIASARNDGRTIADRRRLTTELAASSHSPPTGAQACARTIVISAREDLEIALQVRFVTAASHA